MTRQDEIRMAGGIDSRMDDNDHQADMLYNLALHGSIFVELDEWVTQDI